MHNCFLPLQQVDGYRVFSAQGPQPYALAVLGKFSGVLAGPSNPVNGASASPGDCSIVAAQITSKPPSLTNSTYDPVGFALPVIQERGRQLGKGL